MAEKRLGGRGIRIENQQPLTRVHEYQLKGMGEAVARYRSASFSRRRFQNRMLDEADPDWPFP